MEKNKGFGLKQLNPTFATKTFVTLSNELTSFWALVSPALKWRIEKYLSYKVTERKWGTIYQYSMLHANSKYSIN